MLDDRLTDYVPKASRETERGCELALVRADVQAALGLHLTGADFS